MQGVGDAFLAAARLALDQHRERRRGELRDLAAQLLHQGARADELVGLGGRLAGGALEHALQRDRVARLGDEFPGAEGARVARVGGVVLPREHENLHRRGVGEKIADQAEAFVGRVRRGRQAQVHERKARRARELAQQLHRLLARVDREHLVIGAERESERVGDQRVVVDHEKRRFTRHECTS